MDSYREKLVSLLKEEISLLEDKDLPIKQLYRSHSLYLKEQYKWEELHEQLIQLTAKVDELASKKSSCALAEGSDQREGLVKYLAGLPNKTNDDRKHLSKQMAGAEKIIFVDPYFFLSSKTYDTKQAYLDFIIDLIPLTVKELEIYYDGSKERGDRSIKDDFDNNIKLEKIKKQCIPTHEIHDRVLIKDDSKAFLIGASLNGYGSKFSFVLPLPDDDFKKFKLELDRIKTAFETDS